MDQGIQIRNIVRRHGNSYKTTERNNVRQTGGNKMEREKKINVKLIPFDWDP